MLYECMKAFDPPSGYTTEREDGTIFATLLGGYGALEDNDNAR